MIQRLRIATRKSPLALWQSNYIRDQLLRRYPGIEIEFVGILTKADKMVSLPLIKIGGKGLFVKELEQALLDNKADIAIHSIKDMPAELPQGLELAVVCKREDPRDAFVSNNVATLFDLPIGASVGTSSLRRKAQILALRPDLEIRWLRGNVETRLKKLDQGEFDAIVLAAAGLKRLDQSSRIRSYFSLEEILPAAGQGAIGIECRSSDKDLINQLSFLNDTDSAYAVLSERSLNQKLGGSCQFPIAAYGSVKEETLYFKAKVAAPDGSCILSVNNQGPKEAAATIGQNAAHNLIDQGADTLLQKILSE